MYIHEKKNAEQPEFKMVSRLFRMLYSADLSDRPGQSYSSLALIDGDRCDATCPPFESDSQRYCITHRHTIRN